MEQHSSSLKVAGSSQKYSATLLLRASSSWRWAPTSASLASALWENDNMTAYKEEAKQSIQKLVFVLFQQHGRDSTMRNVSICCRRPGCLPLYSFTSSIFLISFSKSAITSSLQILLASSVVRWHYKTVRPDSTSEMKTSDTVVSEGNQTTVRVLVIDTLMPARCFQAGWEKSATLHRCPLLAVDGR